MPEPGDLRPAVWAASFVQAIPLHRKSHPFHERRLAVRATGGFQAAHLTGKVARVHIPQAGGTAQLMRPQQGGGRGVPTAGHPVIGMKGGHVPGNIGRQVRQKSGDAPQFPLRIVEPRHHQSDHLQPDARPPDALDSIQHVLQGAPQGAVAFVVEALQVDLAQVEQGPQELHHLRGVVSVGDEGGGQSRIPGQPEHLRGPFRGNQRLVVGGGHRQRARGLGVHHDFLGADGLGAGLRRIVAQGLACDPVLAITTMEVASQHAKRERPRARQGMKEWLLLDGIVLQSGHVAPGAVERSAPVEAHLAHPLGALGNPAAVPAGHAAHPPAPLVHPQAHGSGQPFQQRLQGLGGCFGGHDEELVEDGPGNLPSS